jgi:hypothetical protein
MVAALFLDSPGGGWVESVLTFDPHRLLLLTAMGSSSTLEILDRPLMSFCGAPAGERSKVSALTSLGVLFARVPTELASFKLLKRRNNSVLIHRENCQEDVEIVTIVS